MPETAPSARKRLRVLSIAHSAVSRETGRLRYGPFAQRTDLDVHLVGPQRWYQFGRWYQADPAGDLPVKTHILPIRLPKGGPASWYLHYYLGLKRLIADLDPDVIHLWEEPWSVVAMQALRHRGRAALVLEVDQNILKHLPFPFETMRRFVLARTDAILARSEEATRVCRACGYTGPSFPIGYGVHAQTYYALPRPPRAADAGLRVGYCGRLVIEKGLDDILDAMAAGPAAITLAIKGEGPYEPALRARVAALGLEDRVTFEGWGSAAEVGDFFRSLDISILLTRTSPTVREQFGRAIIESQGCGVPVLGSTCGAIPEVIGPGGWVVPESDPQAILACLTTLLAHPGDIAAKAGTGLANVRERFTYDAVARDLATAWSEARARRDENAPKE
jgi:glycosyltransferase involved in cell wall biosynthesis